MNRNRPHRGPLFVPAIVLVGACATEEPVPTPGPEGWDPAAAAPEGAARAGIVRPGEAGEAALLAGISAEGQGGDIKLYNTEVQFVIQGAYRSHGYVDAGGSIIDADVVRPSDMPTRDTLEDLFLAFGIGRLFHADEVRVVADGTAGGPAIVQATGTDTDWTFIQGALDSDEPIVAPLGLRIVRTYTLAPDSPVLEIRTVFENPGADAVVAQPRDGWIAAQEVLAPWSAGLGLVGANDDVDAAGYAGLAGEAALSLWTDGAPLDPLALDALASSAGIVALGTGSITIPAGGSVEQVRFLGLAPDLATLEADRLRGRGTTLVPMEGTLRDEGGTPVPGARIWPVRTGDGWVGGYAITDEGGRFWLEVEPGSWDLHTAAEEVIEAVDVSQAAGRYGPFVSPTQNGRVLDGLRGQLTPPPLAWARGFVAGPPVPVDVGADGVTGVEITVTAGGTLALTVRDGQGAPLPATIEVLWADGARPHPLPDEPLRTAFSLPEEGGRAAWAWTADGAIDVPLPPGTYDVLVRHGFRHEQALLTGVVVPSAGSVLATASLVEVLPRDAWVSVDSHLHAAPSSDGSLPMEDRLITCAANGVDVPVTTDHDRQGDYRPLAEALGLTERMIVVPGVEVSSTTRGHFNLFPIDPRPRSVLNGGAPDWWTPLASTQELFDRMDASAPGAFVQVNHGRGTGMFDFASYHRDNEAPTRADYWSWGFDGFELINGDEAFNWAEERADWFSFLRAGRAKIPLGVSDSHSRTADCGYGRTEVFVGDVEFSSLDYATVDAALRAGRVIVSGGITLRASIEQSLPGEVHTVTGGQVEVRVRVAAPTWIPGGTLRIYLDGVVVHEEAVAGGTVERLDTTITVPVTADAALSVEVEGTETIGGNWGGAVPYAMTHAFLLDQDGGGWKTAAP